MLSTNAEIAPMHCCLGEPDCLVGIMLLFQTDWGTQHAGTAVVSVWPDTWTDLKVSDLGYCTNYGLVHSVPSNQSKCKEQFFVMLVSSYCLRSCPGGPISIILLHNSNRTLYPALALAVNRPWPQLALGLSNQSLKRRESHGD